MHFRREPLFLGLVLAAFAAAIVFGAAVPETNADISGTPCPGNVGASGVPGVCTGTLVIGGQTVTYAYTQHLSPSGQFRIRLNGGTYNTVGMISMIIHGMPAFASWDKLANPVDQGPPGPPGDAVFLPEEDVNPGRTAYERRDSDGCTGCIVDQVMSVTYAGLASGTYSFDLTVVQNGDSGGSNNLPFYVDAGAPSNGNESQAWGAIAGMDFPCADTFDNDLDFRADCADPQCNGSIGKVSTGAVCQIPELTCNDEFDNDADGLTDCLDPSCDGLVGQPSGTALCQYGNETGASTCGDNFDNDVDGLTDCIDNQFNAGAGGDATTICWKKPAFGCPAVENCGTPQDDDKDKSYDDAWDNAPLTGVNCQDYDCFGDLSCPAQENKTAGGADADAQCFNTLDDDLDHLTDCADTDCLGIANPGNPSQICYDKEFDLGQRYQFCGNSFNDDGDAATDCPDPDCTRRFGNCGPCPAREDYTYDSCADASDNDSDVGFDCADIDCIGKLGTLGHAASCNNVENTFDLCSDGFDNDLDAAIDCADPQCAGALGGEGQICQPAGESACGDGKDNDGDARIDCVDSHCAGIGSCAPMNWTPAACQVVPRYSGPTAFTGTDPTVTAVVRLATHVSTIDTVRYTGSGTYSSVTVIMGDNTDALKYYPYAATAPTCKVVDISTCAGYPYDVADPFLCPDAARFTFVSVAGHAVQIFNTAGPDIAGFDVVFVCETPAAPAPVATYPISLSALKEPGAVPEYGDVTFSTTLYEATAPSVFEVEPEAEVAGTIKVPYGAVPPLPLPPGPIPSRSFRGVPNDPGVGLGTSGICRCDVRINGVDNVTSSDCVTPGLSYTADTALAVQARAEDGAGNLGAYSGVQNFTLNVVPALSSAMVLLPSEPFFKATRKEIDLDAEFLTGVGDDFMVPCDVYIRDGDGNILVNAPMGPAFSFPGVTAPGTNLTRCVVSDYALPTVPEGTAYATIRVEDSDGDPAVSNRKVLYWCDTVPGPGDPDPGNGCAYADFDRDGAVEGLYTTLYSTAPKACDNCIGLVNADQADDNANGVGDVCEPDDSNQFGRCEIDTHIVCSYHSNDAAHGCPPGYLCCPGPSIGIDYSDGPPDLPKDPQLCKFAWGLCTLGGEVCFVHEDCPGGPGLCQDGITSCYLDVECIGVAGTPTCTGADRCEQLLYPWLQTMYGNVFSKKKIAAPDLPPSGQYNATFCITAKETILKFRTKGEGDCIAEVDPSAQLERPKPGNVYTTVLGKLDLAKLRTGANVLTIDASQLDTTIDTLPDRLGGRVIRIVNQDAVLNAHTIFNGTTKGNGTIFIDGGNLTINGDIEYDTASVTQLAQLASLGIIVIDNGIPGKGNLYIGPAAQTVSAAMYVGGEEGFFSVDPAQAPDSPAPLTVYGLVVARKFNFSRSFRSLTQGSERFIYDGRAVVNPPPGFADLTKALPVFRDTVLGP